MNTAERLEVHTMSKNNTQETRIALLEQSTNHIYEALQRIEKRFDHIDNGFNSVESRIDQLDKKFDAKHDALNAKIDSNNKWLIGLAISVFFSAATLGFTVYSFIHKLG